MKDTALSIESVAYEALGKANLNEQAIKSHETICAERYENINNNIGDMKRLMGWFGATIVSAMIAVLGYLLIAQQTQDNRQIQLLEQKIEAMEAQSR